MRPLTRADIRVGRDFRIIAAPMWSCERELRMSRCWQPIPETWASVADVLRQRVESEYRREREKYKRLRCLRPDPNSWITRPTPKPKRSKPSPPTYLDRRFCRGCRQMFLGVPRCFF